MVWHTHLSIFYIEKIAGDIYLYGRNEFVRLRERQSHNTMYSTTVHTYSISDQLLFFQLFCKPNVYSCCCKRFRNFFFSYIIFMQTFLIITLNKYSTLFSFFFVFIFSFSLVYCESCCIFIIISFFSPHPFFGYVISGYFFVSSNRTYAKDCLVLSPLVLTRLGNKDIYVDHISFV